MKTLAYHIKRSVPYDTYTQITLNIPVGVTWSYLHGYMAEYEDGGRP